MAHAQNPDFVFRRNGRVHLNRQWASVQSTAGSRGVRISGSNAGYTMFRGSVKGTGYPLHSSVSPSLPLQCVTVCRHISAGLYANCWVVEVVQCTVQADTFRHMFMLLLSLFAAWFPRPPLSKPISLQLRADFTHAWTIQMST